MSELEDGKACKDLWDFSVERGNIDTETHPIGVLGAGLRSYVAVLEAKLEAMRRALLEISNRIVLPGYVWTGTDAAIMHEMAEEALAAAQEEKE